MAVRYYIKKCVEFKNATGAQLELGELGLNYHESGPYGARMQTVRSFNLVVSSLAATQETLQAIHPGKWWLRGDTLFLCDGNTWVEIGGTDDDGGGGDSITVIGDGIQAITSGAIVTVSLILLLIVTV